MAREMTQQERAAIQSFYYRLHAGVEGGEFQERYEQEDIGRIIELLDETRRAALLEARKAVVSEYLQDPVEDDPGDIAYDHAIRDAVEAIDRLAQEGS